MDDINDSLPDLTGLGNTLIYGASGTGKSTLLALMVACHLRDPNAQAFVFQGEDSMLPLCLSLGGRHIDLGDYPQGIGPGALPPERLQVFCSDSWGDEGIRAAHALSQVLEAIERRRLDGRPTLLAFDPVMNAAPLIEGLPQKLEQWLDTSIERRLSVILTAQDPCDYEKAGIPPALCERYQTKVFGAQPANDWSRDAYTSLGLDERQFRIITDHLPRWDYYAVGPSGEQLLNLALTPCELAFVGVWERQKLKRVRELHAAHGQDWPAVWLHELGIPMDAPAPRWLNAEASAALARSRERWREHLARFGTAATA